MGKLSNCKIDLHLHTTASDGTWGPEELIKNLKAAGIKIFAVTDHNSVKNVETAIRLAKEEDLICIPGVEINADYKEQWSHILGYGIDIQNKELNKLLKYIDKSMESIDLDTIIQLEKDFNIINLEEYKNYTHNPIKGGWKALSYLIQKGLVRDVESFFKLFSGGKYKLQKVKFPEVDEVIDVIKKAGGVAVLAHPGGDIFKKSSIEAIGSNLEKFKDFGLDGVECFHIHNNENVTNHCIEWCKRNDLMITGGSDCHGSFVKERSLGLPEIRYKDLNISQLKKYI